MLKIKNLIVNYGHVNAVKNISFDINKGEIVSILGANGAGKTSTLYGILKLVKEKRKLYFKENDISKENTQKLVKRGLILCPENRRIFPGLNVEENLKMGSFIRGDEKIIWKKCIIFFQF
nr:ATP-binding cassette domain-containing protein [Marinitoga lauensis]